MVLGSCTGQHNPVLRGRGRGLEGGSARGRPLPPPGYVPGWEGGHSYGLPFSPPYHFWATGVTAAAVGRFHQQLMKPPKRRSPDWLKGQPVEGAGVQSNAVKHLMNRHSPYTGYLLSYLQDSPGMVAAVGLGLPRRGGRGQMGASDSMSSQARCLTATARSLDSLWKRIPEIPILVRG